MLRKQKIKSKVLVFMLSFMLLFQSLGSISLIEAKAVEGALSYDVSIGRSVNYKRGNKIPITANVYKNSTDTTTGGNVEFSIKMFNGEELIGTVSQGEEKFKTKDNGNYISILAYFDGSLASGDYNVVVEAKEATGEWIEIGNAIVQVVREEVIVNPKLITTDAIEFWVNIDSLGGDIFKNITKDDLVVELLDKDKNVVGKTSSLIDKEDSVRIEGYDYQLYPFDERIYQSYLGAYINVTKKLETGFYNVVVKGPNGIILEDIPSIEVTDKTCITGVSYMGSNKIFAPGVREFNIEIQMKGDKSKSSFTLDLKDNEGNIVAKSTSSEYGWYNSFSKEGSIIYNMSVEADKNIESGKKYSLKINSNEEIKLQEEMLNLTPVDYLTLTSFDSSKISKGIIQAKLFNFDPNKEIKAELFNYSNGDWNSTNTISTSTAIPSAEGVITFVFNDADGNYVRLAPGRYGVRFYSNQENGGEYVFNSYSFDTYGYIRDTDKGMYGSSVRSIGTNTKSFYTKIVLKNIIPYKNSTDIKLVNLSGEEVGAMDNSSIEINYAGNNENGADLYEISGLVNITGSLVNNAEYKYIIKCDQVLLQDTRDFSVIASDEPSANSIGINKAINDRFKLISTNTNELDLMIFSVINVADVNNLDVEFVDTYASKNYTSIDKASIKVRQIDDKTKDISLKLKVSENLKDGDYNVILKYNGEEFYREKVVAYSTPFYRSYYFGNSTSIEENKLSLAYYSTLNLDPRNMDISLTDINGNTIPLTVVADSIKSQYDNLYFDVVPSSTLSIGKYIVNVKQGNKDLTEVEPNQYKGNIITVTEKPAIDSVIYERTTDNKTNYVIESNEFNTSSTYKAIFYKNGENTNNRTAVKELPLTVTESGRLVILQDQVQDLEQGVYDVFIEKGNIILTRVYFNYTITSPGDNNTTKKASFVINNGESYTKNRNVSLTIDSTGYTQFKVANSEEELETAVYEEITGQKTWVLAEGEGEKTVYIKFKDENGEESEIITRKIFSDTGMPEKPVILSPSEGQTIQSNSYLGIKATSRENIKLYAEVCKVDGENITVLKTIRLYTTGLENDKYVFFRGLNTDESTEGGNLIRVYAEDYAGNKSEVAEQAISIVKYGSIKGVLTKLGKPSAYTSIALRKKNGENYENYRWMSTNGKGEYSIESLEPGDYQLYVYATNGFNEITENITISSGEAVEKNLAFVDKYEGNRGSIKIIAKDKNGNPVSGVEIGINNWMLQQYHYKNTDANGIALFENLPAHDEYNYYFYHDGVSKFVDAISIVKDELKEDNVIVPLMKTISGKVTDKDSKPLTNIEIRIEGKDSKGNTTYNWGRTNEAGEYSVKVEDGLNYSVSAASTNNSMFNYNYYSESIRESINGGEENVDFTLYKGLSIFGKVTDSNGVGLSGLDIYATNKDNWTSYRVKTDSNGEYRFGSVLDKGTYEISTWKPGYTNDAANVNNIVISSLSNPSSTISYNDGSEATVTTEGAIELKDIVLNKYDMNQAFNGGANRVTTDTALTQRGKDITVKVTYQNQSPEAINNVDIKANLPEGVTLVANSGVLQKTINSIASKATGEMTFMIHVEDNFSGDNFIVSAEASFDNKKASIGYANVEIVSATINGPSKDSDGTFKLYGEATVGSKVTIMDKVSGRVFAVTKPVGKWYSVDIKNAEDGNYELIAQVEKDGKTSISNVLKVEVKEDVIEVENASFTAYSGQSIGINEETGVPAFSVWVDMQLKGKDITAYTKLTKALEEGYTVAYEFLGKAYAAVLENGLWTTTIKDWSGSGIEKVYLVIKDANGSVVYKFTVAELIILIDPSGYVYDKATGEKIKGATAICEIKDENGNWVKWDAEKYGQVNPQITDEEGKYGWMVPAGEYRVKVQMNGYKDYVTTSDTSIAPIIIPPPRTDVNIGLEKIVKFEVSKISAAKDEIKVTLTKVVNGSTINSNNVKLFDASGSEIEGTVLSNNSEVTFIPNEELSAGNYSITLKDAVQDAEGTSLDMYTQGFVITSGDAKLDFKEANVESFDLGTTSKVTLNATNYMAEDKEVTLIVALYDKTTNKMIKYSSDYKTLASGDSENFEASIEMPSNGEYKVKYFVWDTLKDMNPYMEAKTVK